MEEIQHVISNTDLAVVGLYFLIVFAIGIFVARQTKSSEDQFLGGRSLTWGFIGLSLFASNISTSTIMGLSGAAYASGIANSVYEWMTGIPLIIAALIFVPLYLKTRITTIPEFLMLRYDRRSQIFFSIATIFASIVVETAGGLYAGSLVLKTFFPEIEIWQASIGLALVAGIYTAFGGLKAVVYTDALQAVVLIIGCGILTYMLFEKLDFSWENVVNSAPKNHFSVILPADNESLPWPGILIGVQLMGFWYWSTNQYIVQRVLGAKDLKNARWGMLLAGFLKIIPMFIIVIPGAMAISIIPGLSNPDMVFPTAVTEVLPVGLIGLVLAGLISAIMSSVDSTLNSSSTLIVIDFIKPAKPNITDKQVTQYGRITTLILMIVGASCAPLIEYLGGIWSYLQQMYAIFVPPVVVLFLVGVFYKRGNGHGAFLTLVLGTLLGITLFILQQLGVWHLHFTITVGIVILICTVIFIVASNRTAPPSEKVVEEYTFNKELIYLENKNVAWYQNYLVIAGLLLTAILLILINFW